jgi:hypothetical protein
MSVIGQISAKWKTCTPDNAHSWLNKKAPDESEAFCYGMVEMGGIEPPSKAQKPVLLRA